MLVVEIDEALLDPEGVVGIAFPLDEVEILGLVPLEERVVENMIVAALELGLMEVVHVKLADEGGEVIVLEVDGQHLFAESLLVLNHEG